MKEDKIKGLSQDEIRNKCELLLTSIGYDQQKKDEFVKDFKNKNDYLVALKNGEKPKLDDYE